MFLWIMWVAAELVPRVHFVHQWTDYPSLIFIPPKNRVRTNKNGDAENSVIVIEYNCAADCSDIGWWGVGFRVPAWRLDVGPIASAT